MTAVRAAMYLRQSKGDEEGISRQRERCALLAQSRDWQIMTEYVDNDVSATKRRGDGTAWAQMLKDIELGKVDVIIATKLDRVLRTIQDLGFLISLNAKLVTVDGEIDLTSAFGEFQATLAAGLARFEVRRKSERQRDANAKRAADGKWVGGRRPFGFEPDGITVREDEAAAIRSGYTAVINGLSLGAIAREWNSRGFTTGQSRQARSGHAGEPSPWTGGSVRLVLRNPRYYGAVRYKGEVMAASAQWPAIVDEATWQAANSILGDPRRARPGLSGAHLLTGIARCGVCGATVHAGGNARKGVQGYRCSASLGHFSRMGKPINEYVETLVIARLSRPDALSLITDDQHQDTGPLILESQALRSRLDSLAVDFAEGDLTASQLRIASNRIQERLEEIAGLLADSSDESVISELVGASDVKAVWEELPQERRRLAISALLDIRIHPVGRGVRTFRRDSITVDWGKPMKGVSP